MLAVTVSAIIAAIRISNAAEVTTNDRGSTIVIDGTIDEATAFLFAAQLNTLDSRGMTPRIVRLTSEGGIPSVALQIGKMIRKRSLMTEVRHRCHSACFFIWAAGTMRSAQYLWTLGLHRPTYRWTMLRDGDERLIGEDYDQLTETLRTYFRQMNIPDRYFDLMMSTSSQQIYFPTRPELDDLRFSPLAAEIVLHKCGWLPGGGNCAERAITYLQGGSDENLAAVEFVPSSDPFEAGVIPTPEKTVPIPRPKPIEILMLKAANLQIDPASDMVVVQQDTEGWRKQIYDRIPEESEAVDLEDAFRPRYLTVDQMKLDLAAGLADVDR